MYYPVDYNIIVLQSVPIPYLCFLSVLRPSSFLLAYGAVNLSGSLPLSSVSPENNITVQVAPSTIDIVLGRVGVCRFDVIPLQFRRRRRVAACHQRCTAVCKFTVRRLADDGVLGCRRPKAKLQGIATRSRLNPRFKSVKLSMRVRVASVENNISACPTDDGLESTKRQTLKR